MVSRSPAAFLDCVLDLRSVFVHLHESFGWPGRVCRLPCVCSHWVFCAVPCRYQIAATLASMVQAVCNEGDMVW